MFWFLSALAVLFWEFCEGVCRLISVRSELSSEMGLMLPGKPGAGGRGFNPLESEFSVVGMGLTSDDSRHELATRAMVPRCTRYVH